MGIFTIISLLETCVVIIMQFALFENFMFCQVRDELEHLLDDEMDMAEMHLTETYSAINQWDFIESWGSWSIWNRGGKASSQSKIIPLFLKSQKGCISVCNIHRELEWVHMHICASSRVPICWCNLFVCRDEEDYRGEQDGSNDSFIGYKPNIEELEMLLEAYFVQIGGTLN